MNDEDSANKNKMLNIASIQIRLLYPADPEKKDSKFRDLLNKLSTSIQMLETPPDAAGLHHQRQEFYLKVLIVIAAVITLRSHFIYINTPTIIFC